MKLEKAIKILSSAIEPPHYPEEADLVDAIKLAIEALKFYQLETDLGRLAPDFLLPGETP